MCHFRGIVLRPPASLRLVVSVDVRTKNLDDMKDSNCWLIRLKMIRVKLYLAAVYPIAENRKRE